jgi:hypothetical protein
MTIKATIISEINLGYLKASVDIFPQRLGGQGAKHIFTFDKNVGVPVRFGKNCRGLFRLILLYYLPEVSGVALMA